MENNKPKSLLKQFLLKISNLKSPTSQINKSMDSDAKPFKLFLDTNAFIIEKDLSKEVKDIVKDLGITNEVPEWAQGLKLESGVYSHGTATTENVDIENDSVEVEDEVFSDLTKAPYNKIFQAHDKSDIASGTIQFAGIVNGDKKLLEKLNESHPMFKNIAGSIKNHSLDSYSVSGQATSQLVFDKDLGRNITKRKILKLHEVSRTSCPVNPDAKIDGLFFVKSHAGGYAYSQEDSKMENTDVLQAIQKSITDMSAKVEKSQTDVMEKIDGMAERLGVVETFQKSLQDEAAKLNKAEDGEEKPKEESKEEPKEEAKPEETKDDTKEEVKKSLVEERLEKVEKALLKPSKAVAKVPTSTINKSVETPMLNHAISGLGYLGRGN